MGLATTGVTLEEKTMLNDLNEFSNTLLLYQLITKPTHKEGNVLDLVLVNNMDIIFDYEIRTALRSVSDHFPILLSIKYKAYSEKTIPVTPRLSQV